MPDLKLVVNNNTSTLEHIADMRCAVEAIDNLLALDPLPEGIDLVYLATKRDKHLYDIAELEKEVDSPESDTEQAMRFC